MSIRDLLQFLQPNAEDKHKIIATDVILGFTANVESLKALYQDFSDVMGHVIGLLNDKNIIVCKNAWTFLVNISADEQGRELLWSSTCYEESTLKAIVSEILLQKVLRIVAECEINRCPLYVEKFELWKIRTETPIVRMEVRSLLLQLFMNLSHDYKGAENLYRVVIEEDEKWLIIMVFFFLTVYTHMHPYFSCVGYLISNMLQVKEVRKKFFEDMPDTIKKLIGDIDSSPNAARRDGTIRIVRNLCFEREYHPLLTNEEDYDIIPRLLLPLAGPEKYTDEEYEKLPLDLQYLPKCKTRDPNPESRKMCLSCLIQICSTKDGREAMRKANAYLILREYHKWETNQRLKEECEDLVNMIIRTEEEIGADDLNALDIPKDLQDTLDKLLEDDDDKKTDNATTVETEMST